MSPAWSPDGKRLAFVSDRAGGNLDLYTVASDGTDVVRLTDSSGRRVLAGLVARRLDDRRDAVAEPARRHRPRRAPTTAASAC